MTLQAEYDGHSFVPNAPVDLPIGAKVEVLLPPRKMTVEETKEWQRLKEHIAQTTPHFPTVVEAMRYLRKRP